MISRAPRLCLAAAALTSLLSGCVAIAIPVLASGAIARQQIKTSSDGPVAASDDKLPPLPSAVEQTSGEQVQLTALKELPAPTAGTSEFADFASFASDKARPLAAGQLRTSVILAEGSTLASPVFDSCADLGPAVVIDLDPGPDNFNPSAPGAASPGLSETLAALRSAGVTILWASSLPADAAQAIYARLKATRLDPDGTDRLLLQRKVDERKQTRLRAAAKAYCVIAMAGDKRGDFDELYDYLRDPAYAMGMERMFGAGWFISPPPIH